MTDGAWLMPPDKLVEKMSNRSRPLNTRVIAGIVREREDLEWVETGVWRRR